MKRYTMRIVKIRDNSECAELVGWMQELADQGWHLHTFTSAAPHDHLIHTVVMEKDDEEES